MNLAVTFTYESGEEKSYLFPCKFYGIKDKNSNRPIEAFIYEIEVPASYFETFKQYDIARNRWDWFRQVGKGMHPIKHNVVFQNDMVKNKCYNGST